MGLFNTLFHVRVSFAGPKIFRPRGLREKEGEGVKSLISMCSQLALPVPNGYIKYPFFPRMILLFGGEDSSNCCFGPHTSGTGQYRNWPHPTLPFRNFSQNQFTCFLALALTELLCGIGQDLHLNRTKTNPNICDFPLSTENR